MRNLDFYTGRLGNRLFQIAYLYSQVKEGIIPDWYVQDYRYFDKYKDEIKKLFGDGIGYLPYTAIHLRVGDNPVNPEEPRYIDNPYYVPLATTGYYAKAIEHFPHGKFLVFSDDQAFAKTYFEGDRFAFDESADDIEAFNKLASCENIVIANSSFSWWAAYLGYPQENKKVCYPSLWFSGNMKGVSCPPEWIQIKV